MFFLKDFCMYAEYIDIFLTLSAQTQDVVKERKENFEK